MTIREATAGDAAAIEAIWTPVILGSAATFNAVPRSAADIAAIIAARQTEGHAFLVAEAEGRVRGFASYGQFRAGIGYARTMEHTVVLDTDMHGRGLGRGLLAALEDHARRAGVHSMIAGVSGENPAGLAFHAALGYRTVAVLPQVGFKFGRWMDLHLMQKLLDAT